MIRRRTALLALATTATLALTACGGGGSLEAGKNLDPDKLTIYSAQHENLTQAWAKKFQEDTGVKVQIRYGSDSSMGAQIVQEGAKSPADVFLTENSPAMTTCRTPGCSPRSTTRRSPRSASDYAPSTHEWVGIAARSTVLVYNPSKITEAELPKSIMDLQDPKWKGKWGAAAGGADFQAIVVGHPRDPGRGQDRRLAQGPQGRRAGLPEQHRGHEGRQRRAGAGRDHVPLLLVPRPGADQGRQQEHQAALLPPPGPGCVRQHLRRRGAQVEQARGANAQKFLAFVTSKEGQNMLATSDAKEYAVGNGVASDKALEPLDTLEAPDVDPFKLNGPKVIELMTDGRASSRWRAPHDAAGGVVRTPPPPRSSRPAWSWRLSACCRCGRGGQGVRHRLGAGLGPAVAAPGR